MDPLFLAFRACLNDYDGLKSDFADTVEGRWTRVHNLHVTICYLGRRYAVEELLERLPPISEKIKALPLRSLAYFKHNDILYARPCGYELERIHTSLCSHFGIEESLPFTPHVTLMRIKKFYDTRAFKEMLERYTGKNIGYVEPNLELMQSRFSRDGVQYKTLKRF